MTVGSRPIDLIQEGGFLDAGGEQQHERLFYVANVELMRRR